MVRSFILLSTFLIGLNVQAQFHEAVFPGESGSALITKLRSEFRPSSVLSYSDARVEMYSKIYNVGDSVECVYTGHKLYLEPSNPDPIGTLSRNGSANGINCEHTFPQSKGAGAGNPRSDMHHLFPTRARVNEARLNFPLGEVIDRTTQSWFVRDREQSDIPSDNRDDYSELGFDEFEPREIHKGNAARAIFYFYAIYREVADSDFFGEMRTTLCEWHHEDPVDSLEWIRNTMIASYQDNKRNPFILDCSLAFRTYCPDVEEQCEFTSIHDELGVIERIYPNPSNSLLILETDRMVDNGSIQVSNGLGQVIYSIFSSTGRSTKIDIQDLQPGLYTLSVRNLEGRIIGSVRFIKSE